MSLCHHHQLVSAWVFRYLILMQIISPMSCSSDEYFLHKKQRGLRPPSQCPHCTAFHSFRALGYYERYLAGAVSGILRIQVRRFRCTCCRRTVSLLPSFAQPYRIVLNEMIQWFFSGDIYRREVEPWADLIRQYWRRFCSWLPELCRDLEPMTGLSPPPENPEKCWSILIQWGGSLSIATLQLTRICRVTFFGRYRCHSPNFSKPEG